MFPTCFSKGGLGKVVRENPVTKCYSHLNSFVHLLWKEVNAELLFDRWTIRARVTSKSSIRTWSNSKGEGRVFNVDLVDESVSAFYIAL